MTIQFGNNPNRAIQSDDKRTRLQQDIDAFLAKGGQVQTVGAGMTRALVKHKAAIEAELGRPLPEQDTAPRSRAKRLAARFERQEEELNEYMEQRMRDAENLAYLGAIADSASLLDYLS